MLHVFLTILKIIGIVLAAIIGLIIFIILLVLLIPIKYQLSVQKQDEFSAGGRASWLLHLVSAYGEYSDGELKYKIRLFGIPIFRSDSPDDASKEEKKRRKKEKKTESRQTEKVKKEDGKAVSSTELINDGSSRPCGKNAEYGTDKAEMREPCGAEISESCGAEISESCGAEESRTREGEAGKTAEAEKSERGTAEDDRHAEAEGSEQDAAESDETGSDETEPDETESDEAERDDGREKKRLKAGEVIAMVKEKLAAMRKLISDRTMSVKEKILSIVESLKNKYNKIRKVIKTVKNPRVKASVKNLSGKVKRLLKAIRPRKLKGYIHFGTEEPSTTGLLSGAAGMLYGLYGRSLKIVPDFENAVFECNVKIRGHIWIIRVLIIGLRIVFGKDFKYLKKKVEAL